MQDKQKLLLGFLLIQLLIFSVVTYYVSSLSTIGPYYLVGPPIPVASYYIDHYTNGSIYAINGSNWDPFLVSSNASEVFEACTDAINGSGRDGKILVGSSGDYSFSTSYIELSDYSGCPSISIIGETKPSKQGVVFTGSGDVMMQSFAGASWIQGHNGAFHSLKNIRFEHTTRNNASITLNMTKLVVELENVECINQNATKQGTGFYVYSGDGSGDANTGVEFAWRNVQSGYYSTGFNVSVDHLSLDNINAYQDQNVGLFWHNSGWMTIQNYLSNVAANDNATYHSLWIRHLGHGCSMYGYEIEMGTNITHALITLENGYYPTPIYGFFCSQANNTLWESIAGGGVTTYLSVHSVSGSYRSEAGYLSTVGDGEYIAHGLADTPFTVLTTIEDDLFKGGDSCILVAVDYKNATHFRVDVRFANGTAYSTDNIEVYWRATINRYG